MFLSNIKLQEPVWIIYLKLAIQYTARIPILLETGLQEIENTESEICDIVSHHCTMA